VTDVHARALADRVQALEDRDARGVVGLGALGTVRIRGVGPFRVVFDHGFAKRKRREIPTTWPGSAKGTFSPNLAALRFLSGLHNQLVHCSPGRASGASS